MTVRTVSLICALALLLATGPAGADPAPQPPLAGKLIGPPEPGVSSDALALSEDKQGRVVSKDEDLGPFFRRGNLTFLPLPAFAYTRNESFYVGGLMPILKSGEQGEINDIFAPQYLYNEFVGSSMTMNYYGYRTDTVQYRAIVNYAERVQQNYDFSYKDLGAGGGRYIIGGQINWFKDPFKRFFGFGNGAPLYAESNYTSREFNINGYVGLNLSPDFSIILGGRYREVRVEQGIIPTLANTRVAFASAPGIGGARIAGGKLTFLYDTRDSQLTPIKGSYVNFSTELNSNVEHDEANRWLRFTLDARHLFPHDGDRKVFVVRFLADGVMRARFSTQQAIPFYERPTLGGENTLRAFGLNRYFDNQAWAINIEERILVYQKNFVGHKVDLEVAPSLDMGKVQDLSVQGFSLNQAQINPGVGFRVMARPHVVGRLDVAYGRDGGNAFVGVDYPF